VHGVAVTAVRLVAGGAQNGEPSRSSVAPWCFSRLESARLGLFRERKRRPVGFNPHSPAASAANASGFLQVLVLYRKRSGGTALE